MLHNNEIIVNNKASNIEELEIQLYQKPNSKLLGFKPRLQLYNLSKNNPDSLYNIWLHKKPNRINRLNKIYSKKQVQRLGKSFFVSGYSNFFQKIGEAPVILDTLRIKKSEKRLLIYHKNRGFFDTKIITKIDTLKKQKAKITYNITTGKPYIIDSIFRNIDSPIADSLFVEISNKSLIKAGEAYNKENDDNEKKRITAEFRNRGLFYFHENYIKISSVDTIDKPKNKLNFTHNIGNRIVKKGDSTYTEPYKIYKISKVNIFTDKQVKDKTVGIDSTLYKNYNFYSSGKLKYRPKALANSIFIEEGKLFSELDRTLTTRSLSNLKVFSFPKIQYVEDASGNGLIANIILTPLKKQQFHINFDVSHSNIQTFGVSGFMGVSFRNIFKGAEILNFSTRGNIGTSNDPNIKNSTNAFFNILEYGADVKLTIPRILFPLNTKRIIRKESFPNTVFLLGLSKQTNIGLDKESYNSSFYYDWGLNNDETKKFKFDLFNLQFVRNLNINNYFRVYSYSYNTLNDLAKLYSISPDFFQDGNLTEPGAVEFLNQVSYGGIPISDPTHLKTINTIGERRKRLIENNLILASSFSYNLNTKKDINDIEFYNIRAKIESSGNIVDIIAKKTNEPFSDNNKRTLFGVEYAQYIKTEFEYIKHLHIYNKSALAFRFFGGIAIPYGNSNSIPFSRSYFAGGSNDNRGWQAYSLGPGASESVNDFNEANLKLSVNLEYRFNIFKSLNGAFFADAGNIWNTLDNVEDEKLTFNGIQSLQDIAVGSGFGLRYDFGFFVLRGDLGLKTYNPAKVYSERWINANTFGFSNTVFNIGINYPF